MGFDSLDSRRDGQATRAKASGTILKQFQIGTTSKVSELCIEKIDTYEDYQTNITIKYSDYNTNDSIEIYSDDNNDNRTFEVCLYNNNVEIFEDNIKTPYMKNGVLEYMLKNKAEAAFRLLEFMKTPDYKEEFVIPKYIKDAIEWISK